MDLDRASAQYDSAVEAFFQALDRLDAAYPRKGIPAFAREVGVSRQAVQRARQTRYFSFRAQINSVIRIKGPGVLQDPDFRARFPKAFEEEQ